MKLVEKLSRKEVFEQVTVYRPWGCYTILEEHPTFKVKKISVNPKQKISLQYHQHRSEHWVVVKGTAHVIKGKKTFTLKTNESTYVPKTVIHRLENIGEEVLEIIEVQTGQYLEEDDIIRLEDLYGRLT